MPLCWHCSALNATCILTRYIVLCLPQVKCDKYWPDGSDFLHCQDLRVKTINQRVNNNFTIRIFELRKEVSLTDVVFRLFQSRDRIVHDNASHQPPPQMA